MELSLIIPAYNEEARLARTLRMYATVLTRNFSSAYELIVVANGCSDNTFKVATTEALTIPVVKVINIPEKIGKGGAILEGFRHARGRNVIFTDADGATTPDSLLMLIAELDRHEIVIGSRRLPDSTVVQPQRLSRRLLGWFFAKTVRQLFILPYHDTQCGAKAFRLEAARDLTLLVKERRWAFDVDLLLCARNLNLSVAERPVVWADQDGSKLDILSTALEVIGSLWRLRQRQFNLAVPATSMQLQKAKQ
jgi:glycosyltransferase involved in cell wall biosynthesis